MEKRQDQVRMNSKIESEELLRELWQEKPGWKHTRTESLRKRVRERIRAQVKRDTGDVPEDPRNRPDEQVAVRHADGYITENQREKMRGIRVNKRGSGATSEAQFDEWRKIERLEQ